MKILFCADPQSANTQNWVNGLRELGCEVLIVSARIDKAESDLIPIEPTCLPPRLRMIFGINSLKRTICKFQPDILVAYRTASYGYIAARAGFHPLVIAAQSERLVFENKPFWPRTKLLSYFVRYAIRHADMLHAWSPNIHDALIEYAAGEKQIFTMHRGINIDIFYPAIRNSFRFNPENPVFISTRSLYSEYRIDLLIEAFAKFAEKFPAAKLYIIGSGPELEKLKTITVNLKIEHLVDFKGYMMPEQLASCLAQSDVYISLIETEGLSSSLLEAGACGLFPIVWDMPASRYILENRKNGLLIDSSDPAEIAQSMTKAVNLLPELLPAVKENAERITNKFDRQKNLLIFLGKYRELVSRYNPEK